MGEMKVEHVLLFLVGAFLVYHMMGKCGRIEGITCNGNDVHSMLWFGPKGPSCYHVKTREKCNTSYDSGKSILSSAPGSYFGAHQCEWDSGSCHASDDLCDLPNDNDDDDYLF